MNFRFFCPVIFSLLLIFTFNASYSQEFRIYYTLKGNESFSFASLGYAGNEHGIAAIDAKGTVKWQIPSPGYIMGMAKFNGNLLFFYTPESRGHDAKEVHAAIVGVKERKILADKVVYNSSSNYEIFPEIMLDPSGNFICLLVRTNAVKTSGVFSANYGTFENRLTTTALELVSINDQLTATSKEIKSVATGTLFANACGGPQHDFYISSMTGDQLVLEKFDAEGKQLGKLSVNAPLRKKSVFHSIMRFDSASGNAVDELLHYENQDKKELVSLFRFDFSSDKATVSSDPILNKDYVKALKAAQSEKVKSLKNIEDLQPVMILTTKDRIIAVKEIQYIYSLAQRDAAPRYTRDAAIISIYTKDLRLAKEILIDKSAETFIGAGDAVSGHINQGKLYVATCESGGIAAYKDVLYTINIQDGTVSSKILDRGSAGRSLFMNPATIFWFPDNFITPLEYARAFIKTKYTTTLQLQRYQ